MYVACLIFAILHSNAESNGEKKGYNNDKTMLKSILFKFHALLLGILFLSFFVFYLWLNNLIQDSAVERSKAVVAKDIQMHASQTLTPQSFVFVSDQQPSAQLTNFFRSIRTSDIIRVNAWDNESRVIYSDYQPIIGKKFIDDKMLSLAFTGQVVASIEEPNKLENTGITGYKQLLEVYIPIYFEGNIEPAGVVEAYFDMNETYALVSKIRIYSIIGSIVVIAIIFGLEWILFWQLVRKRLALLIEAAREVAGGNMDVQVTVKGQDEIGEYARIFNFMASKLKDAYDDMEMKIKDRTKELEHENKQMINRELKMVELKKEFDALRKRIEGGNSDQKNDR